MLNDSILLEPVFLNIASPKTVRGNEWLYPVGWTMPNPSREWPIIYKDMDFWDTLLASSSLAL